MADQGRRGGQPQHPVIQVPRWIDIGPLPDGRFEKEVTFNVVYGKWPAQDVVCRFLVGSEVVGGPVFVAADGLITAKCKLKGTEPEVIAEIKSQRTGSMYSRSLGKVLIPALKRKLEVLGQFASDNTAQVYLRRVGKNGKFEAGGIACFDFKFIRGKPARIYLAWECDVNQEITVIELAIFDDPRSVEFFLPDDREVKIFIRIPAKQLTVTAPTQSIPEKDFRNVGRNIVRQILGKKLLDETKKEDS